MPNTVLAIDPGKFHTGTAVMLGDKSVLERRVFNSSEAVDRIAELCYKYQVDVVLIGSGSTSKSLEKQINAKDLRANIVFVNEKGSTLEARKLFWQENKPRGLMRFLPASLRTPHLPYDDYAAVVIGRRYLEEHQR